MNELERSWARVQPGETAPPVNYTQLRGSVEVSVFNPDGLVLGVYNDKYRGFFGPGGKVEPGETFEDAARRELVEETGLAVESIRFIAGNVLDALPGDDRAVVWYCAGFVAVTSGTPTKCEKHTTPFWTTVDDLVTRSLFPDWYSWWFSLSEVKSAREWQMRRTSL